MSFAAAHFWSCFPITITRAGLSTNRYGIPDFLFSGITNRFIGALEFCHTGPFYMYYIPWSDSGSGLSCRLVCRFLFFPCGGLRLSRGGHFLLRTFHIAHLSCISATDGVIAKSPIAFMVEDFTILSHLPDTRDSTYAGYDYFDCAMRTFSPAHRSRLMSQHLARTFFGSGRPIQSPFFYLSDEVPLLRVPTTTSMFLRTSPSSRIPPLQSATFGSYQS